MLNITQKEKVSRFLKDELLSSTIKEVLETECLKTSKDRDVQNLAAHFLAIEIVASAWKELERYQSNDGEGIIKGGQIGM